MTTTYAVSTRPEVLRRCREAAKWEEMGVNGDALECLLAETAEARHNSRVAFARWEAEQWYLRSIGMEQDEVCPETLAMGAGIVLWMDVVGVGGRMNCSGDGTIRHPALSECGKGRKHATDGQAWSAAILEAAKGCGGSFFANELGYICFGLDDESGSQMGLWALKEDPSWMYSLLREGLRRAAGLKKKGSGYCDKGWHPAVPIRVKDGDLASWAAALNYHNEMVGRDTPQKQTY